MKRTPDRPRATGISRRGLLKRAGKVAAGVALLDRIAGIRAAFADEASSALQPVATGAFGGLDLAYSLDPGVTYLNHASIGTVPRAVQRAHAAYAALTEENPWLYVWGGAWEEARETVRAGAAQTMGCAADDVAITHNTTEAFNLLAQGLPIGAGDEVIYPSLNHSGASVCFERLAASRGFSVRRFELPWRATSQPDAVLAHYIEAIGPKSRVLVLPHIDNTVGLRHPVARIAAAARERGVAFIAVDGAQTVGMIDVDVAALGVDLYATSPHKWLQAPKGLGLAYLAPGLRDRLRPMWTTWGQNRWRGTVRIFEDYGTRDLASVLALGDAIAFQRRLGGAARLHHHRRLQEHARRRVAERPDLAWRSPTSFDDGGALYAVGLASEHAAGGASAAARHLFERHGIVVRPFEQDGLDALRLSPNLLNTTADLDRFFAALS